MPRLLVALTLIGIPACSRTDATCRVDEDCPGERACIERRCIASCASDADCQPGEACVERQCRETKPGIQPIPADCVAELSVGGRFACVLNVAGEVWCWGDNAEYQLGTDAFSDSTTPVQIPLAGEARRLNAGEHFACAVLADNSVWCWGNNSFGQLGDGTVLEHTEPVHVSANEPLEQFDCGEAHCCGRDRDGAVWCWGSNVHGGLGDPTLAGHVGTVEVELPLPAIAVDVVDTTSCAVLTDQSFWCWGRNFEGGLGVGSDDFDEVRGPAAVPGLSEITGSSGGFHTHRCAQGETGEIWCWGSNLYGQLGSGPGDPKNAPTLVADLNPSAQISAGAWVTCVRTTGSRVRCWGRNDSEQLGVGPGPDEYTPAASIDGLPPATKVSVGVGFVCALGDDESIWCWGTASLGRLGPGAATDPSGPVAVPFACP